MPTVLLVEDSPDDAYFFERALRKTGIACHFQHVSDGAEAVRRIREAKENNGRMPNIIFLDLKMPVMSGFEVLEWLRTEPLEESPAVTVLSGSNEESDRDRAADLGAEDYLVKPISADVLGRQLDRFAQ